jgi:hypothetical protein
VFRVVKATPPHIETVRAWIAAALLGILAGVLGSAIVVWARTTARAWSRSRRDHRRWSGSSGPCSASTSRATTRAADVRPETS